MMQNPMPKRHRPHDEVGDYHVTLLTSGTTPTPKTVPQIDALIHHMNGSREYYIDHGRGDEKHLASMWILDGFRDSRVVAEKPAAFSGDMVERPNTVQGHDDLIQSLVDYRAWIIGSMGLEFEAKLINRTWRMIRRDPPETGRTERFDIVEKKIWAMRLEEFEYAGQRGKIHKVIYPVKVREFIRVLAWFYFMESVRQPTEEQIAKHMQTSVPTVRKRIAEAVARGFLKVEKLPITEKLIFDIQWEEIDKAVDPDRLRDR